MKKGLSNRRGEVFTATAVKVIIAVVVGVLILGGLFALYRNVIFPKLNQKVEGMIHTEDTVQVRKDGNSVQYSYDGETWKDCTIPGVSASATVSTVLTRTYQEKTAFLAVIKDGSGARLYVSRDAQEWVPSIGDSKSVSVGNGTSYVTVSCGDGRSYRSHDGIEWEMTSTGFARRVEYIKAHRKDKKHSESAAVARKLSRQLREVLCDEQDNLNRWLERRPCIIRSPWEEGREQEVMIRNDTEALYYFLLYCRKVNLRERISEEFADYVAYILSVCY